MWTGLSSRYTFPFIRSAPRRFLASGLRRISPEFSLTNKPHWQFGDFQEFCCLQNSKTSSSNFHIYPSPPREQSDVQSSVSGRQHWSINQTRSNILKKLWNYLDGNIAPFPVTSCLVCSAIEPLALDFDLNCYFCFGWYFEFAAGAWLYSSQVPHSPTYSTMDSHADQKENIKKRVPSAPQPAPNARLSQRREDLPSRLRTGRWSFPRNQNCLCKARSMSSKALNVHGHEHLGFVRSMLRPLNSK